MLFFLRNSCNLLLTEEQFPYWRQGTIFVRDGQIEYAGRLSEFCFWSTFEEKLWLFHYGNDIEVFLSMCNYINSRACNYTSIYTENSFNLIFLLLSWSNVLFWCFLLLLNKPKIQSKLLLWMPLPLNWRKKANKNYFQEAIAKQSNIKGNFLLEGDGKGEFHASRTGLKFKLSFQDILSLKQQNSNCLVHHYFKYEVLSSMQKKAENENYCSI